MVGLDLSGPDNRISLKAGGLVSSSESPSGSPFTAEATLRGFLVDGGPDFDSAALDSRISFGALPTGFLEAAGTEAGWEI